MDIRKLNADELLEYRKMLLDWKIKGPKFIQSLLDILKNGQFTKSALKMSKIYKSVKTVKKQMEEADRKELVAPYNEDILDNMILRLENVNRQIFEKLKKNKEKEKEIERKESVNLQQSQETAFNNDNTHFTYDDGNEHCSGKQRQEVRDRLNQNFLKWYQQVSGKNPTLEEKYQLIEIDKKIEDTVSKLENQIFLKHENDQNGFGKYQNDLKTLLMYIRKDTTGNVFAKLLVGQFTILEAAQLKALDWYEEKQKREISINTQQSELLEANYYKQLRIDIMSQVKGETCPRCQEDRLYLIEEKQLRRADEPTTKIYECFACSYVSRR